MLSPKVKLYKSLFHKSFFFDKFFVKNVFQCPKIMFLYLKFSVPASKLELSKLHFARLMLLFYLLTGQRPQVLIKYCNLRSTQRKKVVGLALTLKNYMCFLHFLVYRQLPLLTPVYVRQQVNSQRSLTLKISHKTHDDDIFYQSIKIIEKLIYQITIHSNALTKSHFKTLLTNFKIPCTS